MTNTIQTFGLTENQIIRKNGEFFITTKQISQLLDIPINTVQQNIYRNKEEFGEILVDKLSTNSAGRPSILLDEEQFYIYCMIATTKRARMVRGEFSKMIKAIRQKEFIHISEVEKMKKEIIATINTERDILSKVPKMKLNRYKKYRGLGMSRKELCKALELSYRLMRDVDKILGFHKPGTIKQLRNLAKYNPHIRIEA